MRKPHSVEWACEAISKVQTDWQGLPLGPMGIVRGFNCGAQLPPMLWFFNNARHELNKYLLVLERDQPLFAFRTLSRILKPSPERYELSIDLVRALACDPTINFPRKIAFIGGLCEGAHYAVEMANQLTARGHEIGMIVTLDGMPEIPTDVPILLTYGRNAEYNPFRNNIEKAELDAASLFRVYQIAELPCRHRGFFRYPHLRRLFANIKRFSDHQVAGSVRQ